jgi:hypothetical protein
MRPRTFTSTVGLLFLIAGCASRPANYTREEDIPTTTSWHTNEVAYAAFRFGYASGYNEYMRAHAADKGRIMWSPDQPVRDGYLAGVAAAYDVWDKHWQEYWRTNWDEWFHKHVPPPPIKEVK